LYLVSGVKYDELVSFQYSFSISIPVVLQCNLPLIVRDQYLCLGDMYSSKINFSSFKIWNRWSISCVFVSTVGPVVININQEHSIDIPELANLRKYSKHLRIFLGLLVWSQLKCCINHNYRPLKTSFYHVIIINSYTRVVPKCRIIAE